MYFCHERGEICERCSFTRRSQLAFLARFGFFPSGRGLWPGIEAFSNYYYIRSIPSGFALHSTDVQWRVRRNNTGARYKASDRLARDNEIAPRSRTARTILPSSIIIPRWATRELTSGRDIAALHFFIFLLHFSMQNYFLSLYNCILKYLWNYWEI